MEKNKNTVNGLLFSKKPENSTPSLSEEQAF